ncbi:MAG: hypothetical protein ACOCSD_04355 [Halolamina sp.]
MVLLTVGAVLVQTALLAVLVVAYRRENTAAVVNTAGAVLLTLVPAALAWALDVGTARSAAIPGLTFVVAVAGFLHCLGMLGRYETVGWWDHLTHTLSAALLAALLYAWLLVDGATGTGLLAGTVLGTFALGVVWELGELIAREVADWFDIEPVLVHYGWRDTALDLVFDLVGAALIVAFDVRLFVSTVETVGRAAGVA